MKNVLITLHINVQIPEGVDGNNISAAIDPNDILIFDVNSRIIQTANITDVTVFSSEELTVL